MSLNERKRARGDRAWRSDPYQLLKQVDAALKRAVRQAIAEHHRAGDPVAIWRNGQIVLLYPDGSMRTIDGRDARPEDGAGHSELRGQPDERTDT